MAADNFFIPNAEEFFASILSIFSQCTACLDVRDGDLEQYEETLRVMYQRITESRPDQGALRCDIEQLLNALRRILERLESLYCDNNEENDYEDITSLHYITIYLDMKNCHFAILSHSDKHTLARPLTSMSTLFKSDFSHAHATIHLRASF